jgi:hypothetical protein
VEEVQLSPRRAGEVLIGIPGISINTSTSEQILNTLRTAVSSDIFVVDVESGHAWWERRLVVWCAARFGCDIPARL